MEHAMERDRDREMTVESLRAFVGDLAEAVRASGNADAADQLDAACAVKSSPPEEVLVMREAMVRTRPVWGAAGSGVAATAARVMNEAKRLAIGL